MRASFLGAAALLALAGCETTVPVAVIGEDGTILRGSAMASLSGGSFSATNGILTCAGSYNALDMSVSISFPVQCSDGRKGIVIATRQGEMMQEGFGRVRLDDGMQADFVFGRAAEAF